MGPLPDAATLLDKSAPRAAKAVLQISKGYVTIVAHVPAAAPEQNATAVGLDAIFSNGTVSTDMTGDVEDDGNDCGLLKLYRMEELG